LKFWIPAIALVLVLAGVGAWLWFGPAGEAVPEAVTLEADPGDVRLGEEKQRYIWDMEHATFQIENYLGKPLVAAIRDGAELGGFFRRDFEGRVFEMDDPGRTRRAALVTEVRRLAGEHRRTSVDGAGFAAYLRSRLADFSMMQGARVRVLHLDRTHDDEGRWDARVLLTVSGADAQGEPRTFKSILEAGLVFVDGRKIADGPVLNRLDVTSEVLAVSRRLLMEEATERFGLADLDLPDNWKLPLKENRNQRYQLAAEDFNRDGFMDVILGTNHGRPYLLMSVEGRRFEEVAHAAGLPTDTVEPKLLNSLVAWIDYDNDGYPDLILGGRLYHNLEGKGFQDVTHASRLVFNKGPLGCTIADFNADGLLDIYALHQLAHDPTPAGKPSWVDDEHSGARNELWLNEGDGRFRNVTQVARAGAGRRQTFAASAFFYDDDRFPDLYVANDFGRNVLLRNLGDGTFEDLSGKTRAADFATSMGVATGDLDNDGTSEIYVANMYSKMGRRIIAHVDAADYPPGVYEQIEGSCAGNRLYRRAPGRSDFEELSDALEINGVGWAYAPSMVDLDGDGWLDLYATTGFMSFGRGKPDG